ncbi:MAG: MBL fold metallo-hydrolase [Patescibacteria group bacterium]
MNITFHGGAKMVTGANYVIEHEGVSIAIDCGLHQGSAFCEKHNWESFPYDPSKLTAVFVTHAHIDHTGRLPQLVKRGFRGKVYSTPPTRDAAILLLEDSDHLLAEEAERFGKPPIYEAGDIVALHARWETVEYHTPISVGPFTVTFFSAGHILGSAFIMVEFQTKLGRKETVVFSGDLGNSPTPLIGSREELPKHPDYLVLESTYGDRAHEDLAARKEILEDLVEDTVKRRGVLMIPAFAMERTQEILYELNDLAEAGRIPRIPIFLDSPLAIKLTDVYRKYDRYLTHPVRSRPPAKSGTATAALGRPASNGDDRAHLFRFPGLTMTETTEASKAINSVPAPKIIIAGSGMLHGGRILHHAKRYLPDPKSTLLLIGYQAAGSIGRQIFEGASHVRIHHEDVPVAARVKAIGGYSAHADQPQLLGWVRPARESLRRVFLVQGEPMAADALARKIVDEFAVAAEVPDLGDTREL